MQQVILPFPGA